MERVNVLVRHVPGYDKGAQLIPESTSATEIKTYPSGKKHYATDPAVRLGRYPPGAKAITIPQKFKERVKALGDHVQLREKQGARDGPWTEYTWKQFYDMSVKVAQGLIALGCAPHQAINILGWNSTQWFFAAMGGIFAGMTPAGIYITNAPDAVEYILNHSKAPVVFVDSNPQLQKVLEVQSKCPHLKAIVHWGPDMPKDGKVPSLMSWEAFLAKGSKESSAEAVEARIAAQYPDNACYLSYTSGTTGNPKAVMYNHDCVTWGMKHINIYAVGMMEEGAQRLGVKAGLEEREISYLPLSHIAGNVQLLGALTYPDHIQSCIHFAFPDAMQGSLPQTLTEVRPTAFIGVPRVWEKFCGALEGAMKAKPELKKNPTAVLGLIGLDKCKVGLTGAAPISSKIMGLFDDLGLPIYEIYGMTENTAYSHFNHVGKRKIGSVGPALTDEGAGSKLAPETGEICTWSRAVMMGYMYNEEKSADTFDEQGFLRTGDVGEVIDGFTFITGRIKEMIITGGGENCAPVLLEEAIKLRLPALSNVMMIGDKQKYLIAMITLKLEPDGKGAFTNKLFAESLAVDPACKTIEDAQKSQKWKDYINHGIEEANKVAISRAQNTRKWFLLSSDFSPVGEIAELTPTMKLKRDVVQKKFLDKIKGVYGEDFVDF